MEQRLRSTLPPLAAWAVIGACVLFWVLSAFGLLRLPASVPSFLTFLWLYLNALAVLLSAVAAAAAVAALVLHRRESRRRKREHGADLPGPTANGQTAGAGKTSRPDRRKRKRRQL